MPEGHRSGQKAPPVRKKCRPAAAHVSQPALVEAVGQQLPQAEALGLPLTVEADDLHLRGEFHHHLAAGAAGHAVVLTFPGDDDAHKVPVPLADGLEDGGALGADGAAVGGVFNVAAGENRAVGALQRRPHRKVGIGDIGPVQHGHGGPAKLVSCHEASLLP